MTKTYTVEAIVLDRRNYAEADRIVTLFTQEKGKLVVLAKGVRKLNSKRLGSLEIGTHLKAMIVVGKAMDILSQTVIIDSYQQLKNDLPSITRLYQLLEVVNFLTGEDQENPEVYQILIDTMSQLNHSGSSNKDHLLAAFHRITSELGFATSDKVSELNLKARIEAIADKKLHSKDFFTAKTVFEAK